MICSFLHEAQPYITNLAVFFPTFEKNTKRTSLSYLLSASTVQFKVIIRAFLISYRRPNQQAPMSC